MKILLTSDQQERYNTLANYQKVYETAPDLDAIFFAGDLVNHPRRATEWFDNCWKLLRSVLDAARRNALARRRPDIERVSG